MRGWDNSPMRARMDGIGLAVLGTDSGFAPILARRWRELGWRHRWLEAAPGAEAMARRRVNPLVLDLSVLEQERREWATASRRKRWERR